VTQARTNNEQSLRVSIDDLRLGMFISELDRPWLNSPFMLQGFLLTEELDRTTLLGLVQEVTIDPARSQPESLLHLPWDIVHVPTAPASSNSLNDTSDRSSFDDTAALGPSQALPPFAIARDWFSDLLTRFREIGVDQDRDAKKKNLNHVSNLCLTICAMQVRKAAA